jgi:DNA helicase-2/ATP-dependent DNA helicase PcrA
MLLQLGTSQTEQQQENIKEFRQLCDRLKTWHEFWLHMTHMTCEEDSDQDDQIKGFVSLMTLHTVKGLEFDSVILPGWEEKLFPHKKSLEEPYGLEEERRLAYVGMTRARHDLMITYAFHRSHLGHWTPQTPSRFLKEIPESVCLFYNRSPPLSHTQRDKNNFQPLKIDTYQSKKPSHDKDTFQKKYDTGQKNELLSQKYPPGISQGSFITHKIFGRGQIIGAEGECLSIRFSTGEIKKILIAFVNKI